MTKQELETQEIQEATIQEGAQPRRTARRTPRTQNADVETTPYENTVYTIDEVASILNISSYTVQDMLRKGELKGSKVRTRWRITKKQVDEYMSANQVH